MPTSRFRFPHSLQPTGSGSGKPIKIRDHKAIKQRDRAHDIFVFRSKRNDRIKLLAWDGSGMVLATKWLEQGHFVWPPIADGAMCLTATQLALLLDGLAWSQAVAPVVKRPVFAG